MYFIQYVVKTKVLKAVQLRHSLSEHLFSHVQNTGLLMTQII